MFHVLRTARYDALLDALLAAVKQPLFADAARESAYWPADAFVADVVRRLRRGVGTLGDPPSDADLHRVRILAKRCRYAAEMTTR